MILKLLFVVNVDWFFKSHRLPIAMEAMEKGYKVYLACRCIDDKAYLESLGITVYDMPFSRSGSSPLGEIKTLISLLGVIRLIEPDLIHSVTIKPVLYTGLIGRLLKNTPVMVFAISGLGYVFSSRTFRSKVTKMLISPLYKIALNHRRQSVIFQNSLDEKILTKIANIKRGDRTLIKGSGVDLNRYVFVSEPDSQSVNIVMAARVIKEKGVPEFVNAAARVKEVIPTARFILAGPVDTENPQAISLSQLQEWEANKLIEYIGETNDIPSLFSSAHIVVLPSYYGEGLPKVLIEAAACGRAVVTTDLPGCRDAVIDGVTGLLIPPRNAEELANAIIKLINDPDSRKQMGRLARDFAVSEFDVAAVVRRHLTVYSKLLHGDGVA